MIKKKLFILAFLLLLCPLLAAKIIKTNGHIYISQATTAELQKVYKTYHYQHYLNTPGWQYPPIFSKDLPQDFAKISDLSERNNLFLQITIPLSLKVAEETLAERKLIETLQQNFIKNKKFSPQELKLLEEKAKKYDLFTRLEGLRRASYFLDELLVRIDVVSPSILIAAAAIESDWGTSRPALKANNLYKQKNWHSEVGLEPESEDKEEYRFTIFPSLKESMAAYALKLNSGVSYDLYRYKRKSFRKQNKTAPGRFMAHTLIFDSPLENFSGLLDYTITFYDLTTIDNNALLLRNVTKN